MGAGRLVVQRESRVHVGRGMTQSSATRTRSSGSPHWPSSVSLLSKDVKTESVSGSLVSMKKGQAANYCVVCVSVEEACECEKD